MADWRKRKGLSKSKEDIWFNLPMLMEECGELCETITKGRGDTAEEIADVILITICCADVLDIDVNEAIEKKLIKLEDRKLFNVGDHQRVTSEE
jgi:NTP pyrophosphatase (non-canonical NTP hydrolase)